MTYGPGVADPLHRTARVLAIGEPSALSGCLEQIQSMDGLTLLGLAGSESTARHVIDALEPDLVLAGCGAGHREISRTLLQAPEHGPRHHDVVLVTTVLDAELLAVLPDLNVLACLVAPVEPDSLEALLGTWLEARADAPQPDGSARWPSATATTLELVGRILQESSLPLSALEVGRLCNVSAVASRRYLKQLVDRGEAVRTVQHGRTGRPRHLYRSAV